MMFAALAACDPVYNIPDGMIPLYAMFPGAGAFSARARLTLPRVASNTGWYGNSVMIIGPDPDGGRPPFVQAGLARDPAHPGLRAFLSWRRSGRDEIAVEETREIPDGEHLVAIRQTPRGFVATVDGHALDRPVSLRAGALYAQFGPEVDVARDALSGSLERIVVAGGGLSAPIRGDNACRYQNRGTLLVPSGDGYRIRVAADPLRRSTLVGRCEQLEESFFS